MTKRILLCLVGLLLTARALSQTVEPTVHHFTIEHNLPSLETYMVIQDSKGYMWFATDRGVAKYDGYEMQTFTTKDGLCDNSVLGIYEDYKGRIWFFTYSNQLSYYENGEIHDFHANDELKALHQFSIPINMVVDQEEVIWMAFKRKNMFLKITPDGALESILLDEKNPYPVLGIIEFPPNEQLWTISGTPDERPEIVVQDTTGQLNVYQERNANVFKAVGDSVSAFSFYATSSTDFLFSVNNEVYKKTEEGTELKIRLAHPTTLGLLQDRQENIWVAHFGQGVYVYRKDAFDQPAYSFLADKLVSWITQDKEGGIWLTTLNDGVFYVPSIDFLCVKSAKFFDFDLIKDIDQVGPSILLGFYQGGIAQVDFSSALDLEIKHIPYRGKKAKVYGLTDDPFRYLAIVDQGAIVRNLQDSLLTITHKPHFVATKYDEESVLLSNSRDIFLANFKTGEKKVLYRNQTQKAGSKYRCMALDTAKNIWLGTHDGLWFFDQQEMQRPPHKNHLLNTRINGIAIYQQEALLATLGEGLVLVSGDSIWQITESDGLSSDLCNDVLVDEDGEIWVSTNKGLSRIYIKDWPYAAPQIRNYSYANGLLSSKVDEVVVVDSLVWVRNDNGLTVFNKYLQEASTPPEVYIQQFNVNNKDTLIADAYRLRHNQNTIQIGFVGISFKSGAKRGYKYRLVGLDTTWQYTKQTTLVYPKLPPGEYVFEVMAKNYKNEWSREAAALQFTIEAAFWQSNYFILASVSLFFFGLLGIVYLQLRAMKNKTLLIQQSIESEQKALRTQLNPHFIFNVLASVQDLIESGAYKLASQHLSSVARIIRKVLTNSRSKFVSIEDEMENLKIYLRLEKLRLGDKLNWEIEVDPAINARLEKIPPMMIQPFVENAIWHGLLPKEEEGGFVHIQLLRENKCLCCRIKDNGIGREQAALLRGKFSHQPLGMKIISERIDLLNKYRKIKFRVEVEDLKNTSQKAIGTCASIFFPLNLKKI